jgi:2-amino-4-hydroxy-6-hydroxymethyldihydropteridine diphosphokinase
MNPEVRQAFVGLGANLGDRELTLKSALEALRTVPRVSIVELSSLYETDPVGGIAQPKFLNAVAGIETMLTPEQLLDEMMQIERSFGRIRTVRNGPRTLDLDLLAYEGEVRATEKLALPHPRMFERAFVVVPLREVVSRSAFVRTVWSELRNELAKPLPISGVRLVSNSQA